MRSKFGQIRPTTEELAALERLKISPSVFIFYWIFFILSGNKDNHKNLDEFDLK